MILEEGKKSKVRPLLNRKHKEVRLEWAKRYLKTQFDYVISPDMKGDSLGGPSRWERRWVGNDIIPSVPRGRQGGWRQGWIKIRFF